MKNGPGGAFDRWLRLSPGACLCQVYCGGWSHALRLARHWSLGAALGGGAAARLRFGLNACADCFSVLAPTLVGASVDVRETGGGKNCLRHFFFLPSFVSDLHNCWLRDCACVAVAAA